MKKISLFIVLLLVLTACKDNNYESPKNIRLEGDSIMFDVVSNALYYQIEINDELIDIEEPIYKLTNYGIYTIRVRSVFKDNEYSLFSDQYTFNYQDSSEDIYVVDGQNKVYIVGNDLVITFHLPSNATIVSITAPNNDINKDEYEIKNNQVFLKEAFLKRKFEEDRMQLILAFVISHEDKQQIFNIFITKS